MDSFRKTVWLIFHAINGESSQNPSRGAAAHNASGRQRVSATVVKVLIGLRPTVEAETQGLDITDHQEEGYVL